MFTIYKKILRLIFFYLDDFPFTRKTPTTPPNVEEAIESLSSPARKKRRTTTGVEEIGEHSDGNISNYFEFFRKWLQHTKNFKINILLFR